MNPAYRIELASDIGEGDEFLTWLLARGHAATLGCTTASYVDGVRTSNESAYDILEELWYGFCTS